MTPSAHTSETGAGMSSVVHRNIKALMRLRADEEQRRGVSDRVAAGVTQFAGSMVFVCVHAVVYGLWVLANLGLVPGLKRWDPTFVMLATIASVEAIFLSTFILITQNRMQRQADRRAELDLQISLLTEHELTKAIRLLDALAERLGVEHEAGDLREAKRDVNPAKVARAIEEAEAKLTPAEEAP